jgi:CheY-like chemotaxis protein
MRRNQLLFLVDDDVDDHEIFKSALTQVDDGIVLLIAGNGQDALKMLSAQDRLPDYIFLDLNMPRMGGIQFLAEIKKSESLSKIPVIVYSTSNHPGDKEKALQAGAERFFTKPARYTELCELLQSLLQHSAK